jgi:hypothetical protein
MTMRGRQSATLAQCVEWTDEEPTLRVAYFADQLLGEDRTQVTEVPWFLEQPDSDPFVEGFDEDQPTEELRPPWLPPEALPLFPEGTGGADDEPAVTVQCGPAPPLLRPDADRPAVTVQCGPVPPLLRPDADQPAVTVQCDPVPPPLRPDADVSFQELVSVWRECSTLGPADDPDPTAIEELALLVFPPVPAPEPRRLRWSLGLLTLLLALAGLLAFGVLCLRPQAWAKSSTPGSSARLLPDAKGPAAGVPVVVGSTEPAP